MSGKAKIVNTLIFCVWIGLLSLVLYRNYSGTALEKAAALRGSIAKATHWYDVYVGGEKIGHAFTSFEKVGQEIIIRHERELTGRAGETPTVLLESMRSLCDPAYTVKSFEYSSRMKDGKGVKITGEVDSENILLLLESQEKRKTYTISTKGRTFFLPTTFIPALVQKNPAPHSVFTAPVLDVASLSLHEVKAVVEEVRPVKVGISVLALYKIRAGETVWWSNEKGIIVKEETQGGMTLYSQTEMLARDPSSRVVFDYTTLPSFQSNRVLRETQLLKTLKVRIDRFPLLPVIYERSTVTASGDRLTIDKVDKGDMEKRSYPLPSKDSSLSGFLVADKWITSEDERIRGNALNMASLENNDAYRLARYLTSNLYFTVKPVASFFVTDAKDVFKSKTGDYLQRTVMFASFARAAGLPTRLVSGLVYLEGYFYFHIWPEIWLGQWVAVDPTLAQFPADVTHIPLRTGTMKEITAVADEMKSLTIEVLEAS